MTSLVYRRLSCRRGNTVTIRLTIVLLASFAIAGSALASPSKSSTTKTSVSNLLLAATPSSGRLTVKTVPVGKTATLATPRASVEMTHDLRKQKAALLRPAPELSQLTK